jgi:hypothetical protein
MDEVETWLEREIDELRAEQPRGTARLFSLTQHLPSSDAELGWLLELELPDGESPLSDGRLNEVLRDMRMLGLTPTLLIRPAPSNGHQGPSTPLGETSIIDA